MRFLRKLRACSALSGLVVMALLLLPIVLLQILASRPDYENEGRTMPWLKGDHIKRSEVAIELPDDVLTLKISIFLRQLGLEWSTNATSKEQNTVKGLSDYADAICALPHISSDTCDAYKELNQVGSKVYTNVFIVIYITWVAFFMTLGMMVSQFMACFFRHHILLVTVCIRMTLNAIASCWMLWCGTYFRQHVDIDNLGSNVHLSSSYVICFVVISLFLVAFIFDAIVLAWYWKRKDRIREVIHLLGERQPLLSRLSRRYGVLGDDDNDLELAMDRGKDILEESEEDPLPSPVRKQRRAEVKEILQSIHPRIQLGLGAPDVGEVTPTDDEIIDMSCVPFSRKKTWFFGQCTKLRTRSRVIMRVRRSHILDDTLRFFSRLDSEHVCDIIVEFDGEPGLDYGGLLREWYELIMQELFDVSNCLFRFGEVEETLYEINPASHYQTNHLRYLNLAGKIIGRALVDSCLVPVEFVRPLYKQMVSAPILLEDIASVDANLCESLMYMHKNSIEGVFFSRFVHTYEELGETKEVPLLPGGEEIEVNESNKDLFISLTIKHKTFSVIAKEVEAFLGGLFSIVPERLLVVFQWYELRSLLCGLTAIDVDDWKKHTTYHSHCDNSPEIIEWFWNIVERYMYLMEKRRMY
eukprot:TRINITY_DN880_c0_g1_i10.p1 TRINITY_DN880_c0_g1~~TRINITY_DN880_c0_g1_i10.p1  ORF type:complete len:640 (-),score=126.42 TRINITY_DN880_c0_g1_i10:541-2460(-)